MKPNNTPQLVVGGVIAVASIAAIVILELMDHEPAMIITVAGPVLAALLINTHVSQVTEKQNEAIHKIEKQTNGVLDKRIEDGVTRALVTTGVLTPEGTISPAPRHADGDELTPPQP